MSNQLITMAERLHIDANELDSLVRNQLMPSTKHPVTDAQIIGFLAVANEYKLNPITREIYAFPAKGGGIQAVVGIDGWTRIAVSNSDFNGMEHEFKWDGDKIVSVTAKVHRKNMDHPITATEFLSECKRNTDPWLQYPVRMLKHKATIQAIRYAFGVSGIQEQDEYERSFSNQERVVNAKENDLEAIEEAVGMSSQQEKIQNLFNKICDQIETAEEINKLQLAFGKGWKSLQKLNASETVLKTIKAIYDERKELLNSEQQT